MSSQIHSHKIREERGSRLGFATVVRLSRAQSQADLTNFLNEVGVDDVNYSQPASAQVNALRFDSMLIAEFRTGAFSARWSRLRTSARRRYMFVFVTEGTLVVSARSRPDLLLTPDSVGVVYPGNEPIQVSTAAPVAFLIFTFDHLDFPRKDRTEGLVAPERKTLPYFQLAIGALRSAARLPFPKIEPAPGQSLLMRRTLREIASALVDSAVHVEMRSNLVQSALAVIDIRHTAANFTVEVLAKDMGVSRRTLERAFSAHAMRIPEEIRIRRTATARRYLDEGRSSALQDIAIRSGFGSAEAMRRALLKIYGMSGADIRSIHRATSSRPSALDEAGED